VGKGGLDAPRAIPGSGASIVRLGAVVDPSQLNRRRPAHTVQCFEASLVDAQRAARPLMTGEAARWKGAHMASEGYHEPLSELTDATRDMHRALVSLMEELEAVDWYNQRVDACKDAVLRAILAHNRDEEKEHAAMLLEWIRRSDGSFEKELRDYIFTDRPLTHD